MIKIEIKDVQSVNEDVAETLSQTLADAIATALVGSPHVDVGEDGVSVKIITTRSKEVAKNYVGHAG